MGGEYPNYFSIHINICCDQAFRFLDVITC